MRNRIVFALTIALAGFVVTTPSASADSLPLVDPPALPLGMSTYQIAAPTGAATMMMPMVWNIPIRDPANPAKSVTVQISVTNIAAFNPAIETAVQASKRKADAIMAAIDAAVTAGTLPASVVTTVKQAMVPTVVGFDMFRRPIIKVVPGLSWIQIQGVTKTVTVAPGDPTKEVGGGGNWQANPGPGPVPMPTPSMGGTGSSSGLSSGVDPSGDPSVVGFGFWDPTMTNPTLFIAALTPPKGETDAQVLGSLATLFDTDFGSEGYSATYNPTTDRLSLNQTIPSTDLMWFADSDTGLNLTGDNSPVPEPGSLILLGTGLLMLASQRRRRARLRA